MTKFAANGKAIIRLELVYEVAFYRLMDVFATILCGRYLASRQMYLWLHARIQRGLGSGSGPPLKNHKNIGFSSNTGPDPLKITKLPSQHSMLGHHRFRWWADDGPLIVVLGSPLPSSTMTRKKKHSKVDSF